jgi:NAD(P)-dependent dehydrogenase (short-subunit alcohol dehydrogenase family)
MLSDNNKKNIILTGANGDIGLAIVYRLTKEGYHLIALFHSQRNQKVLLDFQQKFQIDLIKINLSSPKHIKKTFKIIKNKYSSLYGLINNAGIYPIVPFEKYSLKLWNKVLAVNLTAPFLCIKYSLPLMEKNGGRIINISSTAAHLGSRDIAYSASKAGIIGITKSLARSLAKYNIRVNAIAPGVIDTKMSKRMKLKDKEKYKKDCLLGRFGKPSDVANAVSFLLSKDSDYITGFTLDVNGGLYIR